MKRLIPVLASLAAAAVMAAPAGADMTKHELQQPAFGDAYGTGCSYTVTLAVDTPNKVGLWESPESGPPQVKLDEKMPSGGSATFTWVPKTEGVRHLYVGQQKSSGWSTTYWTVTVKKGLNTGSSCIAL